MSTSGGEKIPWSKLGQRPVKPESAENKSNIIKIDVASVIGEGNPEFGKSRINDRTESKSIKSAF